MIFLVAFGFSYNPDASVEVDPHVACCGAEATSMVLASGDNTKQRLGILSLQIWYGCTASVLTSDTQQVLT